MPEYPLEIAKWDDITARARETGIARTFSWKLWYPRAESPVWMLEILENEEVLKSIGLSLNWLFDIGSAQISLNTTQGAFMDVNSISFFNVADVVPSDSQMRFLLTTWLWSNEGNFRNWTTGPITCETCNKPEMYCGGNHIECKHCEETEAELAGTEVFADGEVFYLCTTCIKRGVDSTDLGYEECTNCEELFSDTNRWHLIGSVALHILCGDCADILWFCDNCGENGWEHAFDDRGDDGYCNECSGERLSDWIHEWNYAPPIVFFPSLPNDPRKPMYMGVEFELNWVDYRNEAANWLESISSEYKGFFYAKSDSSIEEGFEVCTMPMTAQWAKEHFPYDVFKDAISDGADPQHHTTGMHIHMDRTAFSSAQMWKFLKLHRELRNLCGIAGGRGTKNSYASFDTGDNRHLDRRRDMMKIARTKGQAFDNEERYIAVNLKNTATIELRYMQGDITEQNIKKNFQWIEALYDFTYAIDIQDIKAGALTQPDHLFEWICNSDKYPELAFHMAGTEDRCQGNQVTTPYREMGL